MTKSNDDKLYQSLQDLREPIAREGLDATRISLAIPFIALRTFLASHDGLKTPRYYVEKADIAPCAVDKEDSD